MECEQIQKYPEDYADANLQNYEKYTKAFSWTEARALLDGLPQGGLNITHEAVDRHVLAGHGGKLALRWIGRDNRIQDFSYANLQAATNRFANVLAQRGVVKGQRVFSLLVGHRSSISPPSARSRTEACSRRYSRPLDRSRSRHA